MGRGRSGGGGPQRKGRREKQKGVVLVEEKREREEGVALALTSTDRMNRYSHSEARICHPPASVVQKISPLSLKRVTKLPISNHTCSLNRCTEPRTPTASLYMAVERRRSPSLFQIKG